jgi:hypothetical protein
VVHEVLKVETIGDAYFVASGVLEPRKDHAELVCVIPPCWLSQVGSLIVD